MDSKLKVLLVEDDKVACQKIDDYINSTDDVSLVATTGNSSEAIELFKEHAPDAIILDLELHQGGGSGLTFLWELEKLNLPKKPYVLITTNNVSEITYNRARSLGADYILSKYQQNYSEQAAVDFLRLIKDSILQRTAPANKSVIYKEVPAAQNTISIAKRIEIEFENIGISQKAVGYNYLIDAIILIMDKHTACVSDKLALKYDKSSSSITRAMQNAISRAWRFTDPDDLLKYYTAKFNVSRGCPSLMEFIYFYANKLKDATQKQ
ncbi:MAG: response regulator [Christensenellaceae bacterium]|jgi:DNA-binding NarL/FixJ family response regulator|nr:response regulator [Christensenellaceae bacterium]